MTNVAIVYFSGYGHTAKQAEAVREGAARVAGVSVAVHAIGTEGNLPEEAFAALASVDPIIHGRPNHRGGPDWQVKKFADASSKPWFTQAWNCLLYTSRCV